MLLCVLQKCVQHGKILMLDVDSTAAQNFVNYFMYYMVGFGWMDRGSLLTFFILNVHKNIGQNSEGTDTLNRLIQKV